MKRRSRSMLHARSLAHEWGDHDGYHPLDGLLAERMMEREIARRELERRAPVLIEILPTEDGEDEWLVMSPDPDAVQRVVDGLQRGGVPIYARPIERPNEEELARLLGDELLPPMLPQGRALPPPRPRSRRR
jgi:hypothetical protein